MIRRILRRLLPDKSTEKSEASKEQKYTNPINEIQFLEGHTDIVRLLLKIDDNRFCSAGDDGMIIVWDSDNGVALQVLKGHTKPVTCLLLLDRNILLSGSVDRSIKMWDLETGVCIKSIDNAHQGRIQCLTRIDANRFCSGGNDRFLHIWKNDGTFVGSIERQEEENLHCLLAISGNKLVTGSTSAHLLVYTTDTFRICKLLAYHRESVRCLINLSYERFVSAAMDGSIIVWNSDSLTPLYQLEFPEKFKSDNNQYVYSVSHLEKLGPNHIAACFGRGFRVYDVGSGGECVLDCINTHEASVSWLIPLYNGTRLVTSSADASIRLWGTKEEMNFRYFQNTSIQGNATSVSVSPSNSSDFSSFESFSFSSNEETFNLKTITNTSKKRGVSQTKKSSSRITKSKNTKKTRFTPLLLGEMWAHSRGINMLLSLDQYSFASAASDGLVIVWKDGRVESERRSEYALQYLLKNNGYFFDNDDLLEEDYEEKEKSKNLKNVATSRGNNKASRSDHISSDQENPSLEDESFSTPSEFSEDSNIDTPHTNSTNSFSTAREYNEMSVLPSQSQNTSRRLSTGDLFDSLVEDDPLDDTSTNNNLENSVFVTEVPQHIYDPAELLYLEKKLPLSEIAKILKQEGHSDSIINAVIQKLNNLHRRS